MEFSRHVYRTGGGIYNLVTGKFLGEDATPEQLKEHFFLKGQERDAVVDRLDRDVISLVGFKLTPTWHCNLRCGHCFVLEKLTSQAEVDFDCARFGKFLGSLLRSVHTLRQVNLSFVGGEITLKAAACNRILDTTQSVCGDSVKVTSSFTTNGTVWNEAVAELASRADNFVVSLDGNRHTHNSQRHAFDPTLKGVDLYRTTLRNIKRYILMGHAKKILVQAALDDPNPELMKEMLLALVAVGVPEDRVTMGYTTPTPRKPQPSAVMLHNFPRSFFQNPCCKWRTGREFVVDASHNVYADYFNEDRVSLLGTLDDEFSVIRERHRDYVLQNIPVLNDPKCLSCDVVGVCWGHCGTDTFLRLSDYCDPPLLRQKVHEFAASNRLISTLGKRRE